MVNRWSAVVTKARTPIILIWLLLGIFGLLNTKDLSARLTTSLAIPGSNSGKADEILKSAFHENSEGTFTIIYNVRDATAQQETHIKNELNAAVSSVPQAHVNQERILGGILAASVSTPFTLQAASDDTSLLRQALYREGLHGAYVSGPPAIFKDVTPILSRDLFRGEIFALIVASVLLLLLLGFSWTIFIPIIFAGITISTTIAAIDLLARKFLMVLYIPNIVELIGLGLAIDYSLLIVHRFHRELSKSATGVIERTLRTAGKTVVISGFTVAAGLATLLLVPIPFIRSLGLSAVLVPIISTLAAVTLAPALLSLFGARAPRNNLFSGVLGEKDHLAKHFERVARFVIARPVKVISVSILFILILSSGIFSLLITPSSLTKIPANLESSQAISLASSKFGAGIITPQILIIDLGSKSAARDPKIIMASENLASTLSRDSEVFIAANGNSESYVDESGRYRRIFLVGNHELGSKEANSLVSRLRALNLSSFGFPQGADLYLGGANSQGVDLLNALGESLPKIAIILSLVILMILVISLKSIVLPLKAFLLDLLSIGFAIGSLVPIFKYGIGRALVGSYQLSQIEAWVLLLLFVLLFGLSMDYEIFIVSRIRESWLKGNSLEDSVTEGVSQTGGVVSAAAVIFIFALTGLIFGHFAGLQELGIGLALGVLIDATIIRILILPAAMVLLGRWNWWMPKLRTSSTMDR